MRTCINRWHPTTCKCVIEVAFEINDDTNEIFNHRFLLMNEVCDDHMSLMSREKQDGHSDKGQGVLDILEQIKNENLQQVDDRIKKAKRKLEIEDLQKCRDLVIKHNERITIEWQELVDQTHAFDQHIHSKVMAEQPENGGS